MASYWLDWGKTNFCCKSHCMCIDSSVLYFDCNSTFSYTYYVSFFSLKPLTFLCVFGLILTWLWMCVKKFCGKVTWSVKEDTSKVSCFSLHCFSTFTCYFFFFEQLIGFQVWVWFKITFDLYRSPDLFVQLFIKLLDILVSQERPYFAYN